ncbi:uncharacterized protein METZ01_LOCUS143688, partial [marine metagenome]
LIQNVLKKIIELNQKLLIFWHIGSPGLRADNLTILYGV